MLMPYFCKQELYVWIRFYNRILKRVLNEIYLNFEFHDMSLWVSLKMEIYNIVRKCISLTILVIYRSDFQQQTHLVTAAVDEVEPRRGECRLRPVYERSGLIHSIIQVCVRPPRDEVHASSTNSGLNRKSLHSYLCFVTITDNTFLSNLAQ